MVTVPLSPFSCTFCRTYISSPAGIHDLSFVKQYVHKCSAIGFWQPEVKVNESPQISIRVKLWTIENPYRMCQFRPIDDQNKHNGVASPWTSVRYQPFLRSAALSNPAM